jgi:hypothetical protein
VSESFLELADLARKGLGMPDLPLVTVTHPVADRTGEQIAEMARAAVPGIVEALRIGQRTG